MAALANCKRGWSRPQWRSPAAFAHGRVIGKGLGERHVSGNTTGFARVKFDVSGQRPQRFRLIYRQLDDATLEIVAIGPRDEHAIYRAAAQRLTP